MHNQLLFSISLWGLWGLLSTYGVTEYHFISESKKWTEAQRCCRDHYTDLATVSSLEEAARLKGRGNRTGLAWIGLYDDPASWKKVMTNDSNSWRWSATGTTSPGGYHNWYIGDPNHADIREKCVVIHHGPWRDYPCSDRFYYVCSTGEGAKKTFQEFKSGASWEDAVAKCRANNSELATIESSAENIEVTSLVASLSPSIAWIGLYREPWRWSDNTAVNFTIWSSGKDYIGGLHCVADTADHRWSPADCDKQLPFFCQTAQSIPPTSVVNLTHSPDPSLNPDSSSTIRLENVQQSTAPDTMTAKDTVLLVSLTAAGSLMLTSAALITLYLYCKKKINTPQEPSVIPECEETPEVVYENAPPEDSTYQSLCLDSIDPNQTYSTLSVQQGALV